MSTIKFQPRIFAKESKADKSLFIRLGEGEKCNFAKLAKKNGMTPSTLGRLLVIQAIRQNKED